MQICNERPLVEQESDGEGRNIRTRPLSGLANFRIYDKPKSLFAYRAKRLDPSRLGADPAGTSGCHGVLAERAVGGEV